MRYHALLQSVVLTVLEQICRNLSPSSLHCSVVFDCTVTECVPKLYFGHVMWFVLDKMVKGEGEGHLTSHEGREGE
jgi:hypothetical protein